MKNVARTTALIAVLLVPAFAEPNKQQPKPRPETPPVVVRVAPAPQLLNNTEARTIKLPAPPQDREYRSGWVSSEVKLPKF